jgi:hypothetical protein
MNKFEHFKNQLRFYCSRFNLEKAIELSAQIHEAESKGYLLSKREERLWERLTLLIEKHKDD